MSTPRTVKQQARALAKSEGIPYTEARRRVLSAGPQPLAVDYGVTLDPVGDGSLIERHFAYSTGAWQAMLNAARDESSILVVFDPMLRYASVLAYKHPQWPYAHWANRLAYLSDVGDFEADLHLLVDEADRRQGLRAALGSLPSDCPPITVIAVDPSAEDLAGCMSDFSRLMSARREGIRTAIIHNQAWPKFLFGDVVRVKGDRGFFRGKRSDGAAVVELEGGTKVSAALSAVEPAALDEHGPGCTCSAHHAQRLASHGLRRFDETERFGSIDPNYSPAPGLAKTSLSPRMAAELRTKAPTVGPDEREALREAARRAGVDQSVVIHDLDSQPRPPVD